MNPSKFSLADLITLLTALAFGFVCFLGINFYSLGNTSQSIIFAVVIALLLAGTAFIAKFLKRTKGNFTISFTLEIIFLILFTGLTVLFTYFPFSHFFVVSTQRTEIQKKLSTSIAQAEDMFSKYEQYAINRENLYKSKLKSVVAAKNTNPREYAEYGFINGVSDTIQIENKMFTVHADLFPTNYSNTTHLNGIKEVATSWLLKAKNSANNWEPIGVISIVKDAEKNSKVWLDALVEISQIREQGEKEEHTEDFFHQLSFNDMKTDFIKLGHPTLLSIILSAIAYFLMLFSWIISKRSTKTTINTTKTKGEYDIDF